MEKVFPFFFVSELVDLRRLVHVRLLEYLEDEMFRNIRCLIPVTSNLL